MKHRSRLFLFGIMLIAILSISAFADEAEWKQFSDAGKIAFEKKDYSEAEKMFLSALKEAEKFGEQDPRLPASLNNLAETYYVQAKFTLVEPLHKKALEIREKMLGSEHPDLVKSLSSLAKLYCICGKYDKAEPLYKRALKITTSQSIRFENLEITQSLNTLADLYRKQGRFKDGELIYKTVLEVRERLLGPDAPDVTQSLNNLAKLYENQKKYNEAEQYYQRVLEARKKLLGPEHVDVAKTLKDLAETYYKHGKQSEAELFYKQWVEMNEKVEGLENTVFSASDVDAELGGVKSPKIISKVKPGYTDEARKHGAHGLVVLTAVFRKDGTVGDIEIVRSLGYGLDEEAVKSAMQIKFVPGQKGGKPVNVRARLEFTFALG